MRAHPALTRRQFTTLGLTGALFVLASCGSEQDGRTGSPSSTAGAPTTGPAGLDQVAADVARMAADPALAAAVVSAANRFATDLYPLASEDFDNLAFSPLSIAIALAMTSEGARGSSREQIDAVFHLTDMEDRHGGWNAVDQALESRAGTVTRDDDSTDELALTIVNRLWAQPDFTIEEEFLAVLAASYGAGVNLVDFVADPEAARIRINEWVAEQSNDRIPELIPPGIIDTFTRLVLTNAVYFKAPWASPFDEAATRDGGFTLLDGSTAEVPMMSTEGRFAAQAGEGWQAVELAYGAEELEMLIVAPDSGRFAEIESLLPAGLQDDIAPGAPRTRQVLTMPSFEIRTPLPLNDALAALGMPDPFDPEFADFTGINAESGRELYIQAVVHEAFVSVDETGTEAAAATAVVIGVEGALPSNEPIVIDRPFLWAIRDVPTGAILFLGRVLDPSIPA